MAGPTGVRFLNNDQKKTVHINGGPDRPRSASLEPNRGIDVKQAARKKSVVNFVAPRKVTSAENPVMEEPKFCRCINIRKMIIIIGVLELLGVAVGLYVAVRIFQSSQNESSQGRKGKHLPTMASPQGILASYVIGSFIFMVAIGMMFYGLYKKKSRYLLPHSFVQLLLILALVICTILAAVGLGIIGSSRHEDDHSKFDNNHNMKQRGNGNNALQSDSTYGYLIEAFVFLLVSAIMEVVFFIVIRRYIGYLFVTETDDDEDVEKK